ncbi:MAG: response regulator [Chitinophagaceae bacterium]|nr:response regulator [Chitinophagaceae bacterium]
MTKSDLPSALIVDDDADLCLLLSSIIIDQYSVTIAHTLGEASEAINQFCAQLIFLDHHLPDGLGFDFIPTIRERNEQATIIVITADPTGAMRQKVLGESNTWFLSKPFSIRAVQDVLSTIGEMRVSQERAQ